MSPRYGRVVAIDVASLAVKTAFRIGLAGWFLGKGTSSAVAPDGNRIGLADGQTVAILDLDARRITSRAAGRALALGYSPDGARLWKLG